MLRIVKLRLMSVVGREMDLVRRIQSGPKITVSDVLNYLCYTCRRTFDHVSRVSDLPRFLVDKVKTQKIRGQMKSEISEFLL